MTLLSNPAPAPTPRLYREIREDWWQMGRDMLQQQPNLREINVSMHNFHICDRWEFWVVRDPNNTLLQRTIHNNQVVRERPFRQ